MEFNSDQRIIDFTELLSQKESDLFVFNPYGLDAQRNNLQIYLEYHRQLKTNILLLGEASGYNGCRWSGVPFTSGAILSRSRFFNPIRKYLNTQLIKDKKESTATIVYSFFNEYPQTFGRVILWNAFPFHPHLEGNPETNRTPNKAEKKEGKVFLETIIKVMNIKEYHPIGNIAQSVLKQMIKAKRIPSYSFTKIRHPSRGGKAGFFYNLKEIFKIKEINSQKTLNNYIG